MSRHTRSTRALSLSVVVVLTSALMISIVLLLPRGPSRAQSGVIHVDAAASGADDGTSWADAYTDLQSALDAATDGDEVWVAAGVYVPGAYTPGVTETDSFRIPAGVALYGGFAATETVRSERDWVANPTVLSGDLAGDDATDARGVVMDTERITGTNAYHVVWLDGVTTPITESTRVDGVIVTAGQADGSDDASRGGGVFCDGSGGGMCSPSLAHVTFSGNEAQSGGGMYNDGRDGGTSSPTLTDVTFHGNSAVGGGGMSSWATGGGTSSPQLVDVTFRGNVGREGGAMRNVAEGGSANPTLTNVRFLDNRAGRFMYASGIGGAMFNGGYGSGDCSPTLTNVIFRGNRAGFDGGGMHNQAHGSATSNPTLTNVLFSNNWAGFSGGGIYAVGFNGGESSPTLANVTFGGNSTSGEGAGMHSRSYGDGTSHPALTNVILWGNRADQNGDQLYNNGATPTVATSLVENGWDGSGVVNVNGGEVTDGGGNLDADPAFVQAPDPGAANWYGMDDNAFEYDPGDLRLRSESRAIDAGNSLSVTVATDLAGNPRRHDSPWVADTGSGGAPVVDMGAYENQAACPSSGRVHIDQGVGGGTGAGTSWDEALKRLELGLRGAASCDLEEVWVAKGVYTPGITETDTFSIPAGVAMYGGFAATETVRTERDWGANPTVLSGDLAGDDGTDARGVVTDTERMTGTNAYHVVWLDGVTEPITESTRLDGVIITAGQADGGWAHNNDSGGGLYCDGSGGGTCSPSVAHVTFSGNRAESGGGGMVNDAELGGVSSPTLTDVTFSGNEALTFWGGGMYNYASYGGVSSPALTNVTFIGNEARYGGGIRNSGSRDGVSNPSLTNVTFSGNKAGTTGGGIHNNGDFEGGTASPSLTNVTFNGNRSGSWGGGMSNSGTRGGVSSPSLTNVIFSGNEARYGGGMVNSGSNGTSNPTLTNVTFSGNEATFYGGGMYDRSADGGVVSPTLTNAILWEGQAGIEGDQIYNEDATTTIAYSLVEGGWDGSGVANVDGGSVIDGGENVDADPSFVRDADAGDGDWDTPGDNDYGDLRLEWGSPAVDAGNNLSVTVATDLAGNPRIADGDGDGQAVVDMGAHEREAWSMVYLPLVVRNHVVAPDLVVEDIAAAPDGIQVVIRNAGNGAVEEDFWVDVYLDPDPIPTMVNQTWPDVSDQGMVWGVMADLAPGDSLTLTEDGPYYRSAESDVAWPLAAGTPVYAQVDSANVGTTYGAVLESHEITGDAYNNVTGTEVAAGALALDGDPSAEAEGTRSGPAQLPPRPH